MAKGVFAPRSRPVVFDWPAMERERQNARAEQQRVDDEAREAAQQFRHAGIDPVAQLVERAYAIEQRLVGVDERVDRLEEQFETLAALVSSPAAVDEPRRGGWFRRARDETPAVGSDELEVAPSGDDVVPVEAEASRRPALMVFGAGVESAPVCERHGIALAICGCQAA